MYVIKRKRCTSIATFYPLFTLLFYFIYFFAVSCPFPSDWSFTDTMVLRDVIVRKIKTKQIVG